MKSILNNIKRKSFNRYEAMVCYNVNFMQPYNNHSLWCYDMRNPTRWVVLGSYTNDAYFKGSTQPIKCILKRAQPVQNTPNHIKSYRNKNYQTTQQHTYEALPNRFLKEKIRLQYDYLKILDIIVMDVKEMIFRNHLYYIPDIIVITDEAKYAKRALVAKSFSRPHA
jgi:hypothetical protein